MLKLKPNCECCDCDLPPESVNALICGFECTFCVSCAEKVLNHKCPNYGGNLMPRPIRPTIHLAKFPPSTKRIVKDGACLG